MQHDMVMYKLSMSACKIIMSPFVLRKRRTLIDMREGSICNMRLTYVYISKYTERQHKYFACLHNRTCVQGAEICHYMIRYRDSLCNR